MKYLIPVGLVAAIIIGIASFLMQKENDHSKITNWAAENGYSVVSVDTTIIDNGPFWFRGEDDRIYKAVLKDKLEKEKISYFRISFWRFEQAWKN